MTSSEYDLGPVGDFAEGRPRRVEVAGRGVVVVQSEGVFYGLRDACPHQGARLSAGQVGGTALPCRPGEQASYGRVGQLISCPWHGWQYDLATGRALVEPERFRVRSYRVEVRAGRVWLLL